MNQPDTLTINNLNFKQIYSQSQINQIVLQIANKINQYYTQIQQKEGSNTLIAICVLKGGFMFFSDLMKRIKIKTRVQFIRTQSYSGLESVGEVKIMDTIDPSIIQGKNILIVEDIHDSGKTLKKLVQHFQKLKPKRIDIAVLIKRPDKKQEVPLRFMALQCQDFIIGYGIDYDQCGRNLCSLYQKV